MFKNNTVMLKHIYITLLIAAASLFYACQQQQPVQIFMAGDSTMANKPLEKMVIDSISGDSISAPFPEKGWGQLLPRFFSENVIVKNYAKNGRSSRTFIEEGLWDSIVNNIAPNDYVIIQFGHNDQAEDKPERYTPPADYIKNLSRFVDDVLAKKANPIICTSVVRRRFDKEGAFQDSHGEYVNMARQVAAEKGIPMIDMYKKSKQLLIDWGAEKTTRLFLHIQSGESLIFPEGKTDNTHFREEGALLMGSLFVEGLKEENIKPLIKELK